MFHLFVDRRNLRYLSQLATSEARRPEPETETGGKEVREIKMGSFYMTGR